MKNSRKALAMLLALMMVLALAACGSQKDPTPTPDPSTPDDSNKTVTADDISDVMNSADGKYEIAMVTDLAQLKDKSFNQGTWDGVKTYAYHLFGQHVEEMGNGRSIETRENYFFIDDSYLRMALIYGIVILVVVLFMMIVIANRAIYNRRAALYLAMLVIAVHCFMEQHILEMAFNPFLLGMFADMSWVRKKPHNK